jgi:hypothetical protein
MALDSTLIHSIVGMAKSTIAGLMAAVSLKSQTGLNDYGEPSVGAATSYSAVLTKRDRKVLSTSGAEVVSSMTVLIPENVSVSVTDQITLPDGTQPPIISVESILDSDGEPYMVKIYI